MAPFGTATVSAWQKTDKWLMRSASLLLVVLAMVETISAFSGVRYLREFDPILTFLRNQQVLLIAGNILLCVGVLILLCPNSLEARLGLLALCATLILYRLGRYAMGVKSPCPCLGRASDWLHLTGNQADTLARLVLLAFVIIGSNSIVTYHKWEGRGTLRTGKEHAH